MAEKPFHEYYKQELSPLKELDFRLDGLVTYGPCRYITTVNALFISTFIIQGTHGRCHEAIVCWFTEKHSKLNLVWNGPLETVVLSILILWSKWRMKSIRFDERIRRSFINQCRIRNLHFRPWSCRILLQLDDNFYNMHEMDVNVGVKILNLTQ